MKEEKWQPSKNRQTEVASFFKIANGLIIFPKNNRCRNFVLPIDHSADDHRVGQEGKGSAKDPGIIQEKNNKLADGRDRQNATQIIKQR